MYRRIIIFLLITSGLFQFQNNHCSELTSYIAELAAQYRFSKFVQALGARSRRSQSSSVLPVEIAGYVGTFLFSEAEYRAIRKLFTDPFRESFAFMKVKDGGNASEARALRLYNALVPASIKKEPLTEQVSQYGMVTQALPRLFSRLAAFEFEESPSEKIDKRQRIRQLHAAFKNSALYRLIRLEAVPLWSHEKGADNELRGLCDLLDYAGKLQRPFPLLFDFVDDYDWKDESVQGVSSAMCDAVLASLGGTQSFISHYHKNKSYIIDDKRLAHYYANPGLSLLNAAEALVLKGFHPAWDYAVSGGSEQMGSRTFCNSLARRGMVSQMGCLDQGQGAGEDDRNRISYGKLIGPQFYLADYVDVDKKFVPAAGAVVPGNISLVPEMLQQPVQEALWAEPNACSRTPFVVGALVMAGAITAGCVALKAAHAKRRKKQINKGVDALEQGLCRSAEDANLNADCFEIKSRTWLVVDA